MLQIRIQLVGLLVLLLEILLLLLLGRLLRRRLVGCSLLRGHLLRRSLLGCHLLCRRLLGCEVGRLLGILLLLEKVLIGSSGTVRDREDRMRRRSRIVSQECQRRLLW